MNRVARKIRRLSHIPWDIVFELWYKAVLSWNRNNFRQASNEGAVILHLFYQDMWPYFSSKLDDLMSEKKLTLIVSLPTKGGVKKDIKSKYPNAVVLRTPNKGRDVLAFLKIAKYIDKLGYKYILKIHSKKSPQRNDGEDWANKMITDLIPGSPNEIKDIISLMSKSSTAVIGPVGNYVPLTTYYNDNQPKIHWILSKTINKSVADYINTNNFDFGFFAGTMMWLRLEAIRPIFYMGIWANNFPPESAQLDGTIAHAIERVLCVLPEYNKMKIYEMGASTIKNIPYKTDFIPEWSDYYHVKHNN